MANGSHAILALHWQVNVIKPEGFFGGMLADPVARSGVVERAARFHAEAAAPVVFTRFTVPEGEGRLVRNTEFMRAVGEAQELFRPDSPGAQLIPEMSGALDVVDNQKLSGLAGNDLADRLTARGIDTLFITGVATNLTVEQTARHATDLGFTAHVITDCTTAADPAAHEAAVANLNLTTGGCLSSAEALARLGG
jgi:biuret amidohydrolase